MIDYKNAPQPAALDPGSAILEDDPLSEGRHVNGLQSAASWVLAVEPPQYPRLVADHHLTLQ